jgi:hypothetical protein
MIGQTIRNDQFAVVEQSAAGIDDIRNVALTLGLVWPEQGFAQSSNYFGGIIAIEEERTDAVLSHRANTVAEDQPSGVGLDWRAAVSDLGLFPREMRV